MSELTPDEKDIILKGKRDIEEEKTHYHIIFKELQ